MDLYAVDAVGASLAIYNVVNAAIGYYDSLGTEADREQKKDENGPGKLSKKMMSSQGKFIAKMLTRNRDVRTFTPLLTKSVPMDDEEVPEPLLAQPYPLAMD